MVLRTNLACQVTSRSVTCHRFCATLRNYANLQVHPYIVDSPRESSMFTVRVAETSVKTNARRDLRRASRNIPSSRIFSRKYGNARHEYRDPWRAVNKAFRDISSRKAITHFTSRVKVTLE